MTKNHPTIDEIAEDPARLKSLSLDVLALLMDEAKARASLCSTVGKAVQSEVENRFAEVIAQAYQAEAKDTGTVRVAAGDFEVVGTRAKRVEWAQDELAAAVAKIHAAGDDPSEFVDVAYSVPERKYTAWPASIRSVFEPARTVRPGATSIKLVAKEKAAA